MSTRNSIMGGTCLFVTGGSIGWMVGLSASPVVHVVTTTLLTFITGVAIFAATGLRPGHFFGTEEAGVSKADKPIEGGRMISMVYVMVLTLAVASGASFGVFARTNDWLGPHPESMVGRWKLTGIPEKELAVRLLDQLSPMGHDSAEEKNSPQKKQAPPNDALRGALFMGVSAAEYSEFLAVVDDGPALKRLMGQSKNEKIRKFAEAIGEDEKCLSHAVKLLIHPEP